VWLRKQPGAWNDRALGFRTHLGGEALEEFRCFNDRFAHGEPVSFLVSASTALGMTEGVLELGDDALRIRVTVDRATSPAVGLMKPTTLRMAVVLPEPDSPTIAWVVPRLTLKDRSSIARNDLVSPPVTGKSCVRPVTSTAKS